MASSLQTTMNRLSAYVPAIGTTRTRYQEIYKANCDRIYSLAFWMTDNELIAEQLSTNTFLRAFASTNEPAAEQIDRAFLAEVRETTPVGILTLNSTISSPTQSIQRNVKRIDLERAVVQLPSTEKLIFLLHDVESYEHEKIARLLGISKEESQLGLHHARVEIRSLISRM